jgi:formylglycine-generating enzyme required for sulfatase activity
MEKPMKKMKKMENTLLSLGVLLFLALTASAADDCFVKKADWRQTLIASREALLTQETARDNAEVAKSGIKLGDWYYLPIGKSYRSLPRDFQKMVNPIDVTKPFTVKDKSFKWVKLSGLKPGVVNDMAKLTGLKDCQYTLLYNTLTVPKATGRNDRYVIRFSSAKGWVHIKSCRGARAARGSERRVEINNSRIQLPAKPGTYPVLALVDTNKKALPYFWYQPQHENTKAGTDYKQRIANREKLFDRAAAEFTDPTSTLEMKMDRAVGIWLTTSDWPAGDRGLIIDQYKSLNRLAVLKNASKTMSPAVLKAAEPLIKQLDAITETTLDNEIRKFVTASIFIEVDKAVKSFGSIRLAIADQTKTFGKKYPNGKNHLAEVNALEKGFRDWLSGNSKATDQFAALYARSEAAKTRILLDNPLLKFEKLLVASGGIGLSSNWGGACRMGNKLQVLSPVAPDGKLTTIHPSSISSYELDWDAKKILFSDGSSIYDMDANGTNLRKIKGGDKIDKSRRYNPSRMPNGDIMFVSTACEQAVPCTGGGGVANMHVMDKDGKHERRITYDQDHNWDPSVLNNGRVVYTRWEYTDLPHYFSRLLMSMNPDGTDQKEYYGSASYWPNAMYWTKPIPGHASKIVTIVSGHHGVSRMGEMLILDPALGRREADGVVQRIPGYGKKVEPIIRDNLVGASWPKFVAPWPLGTDPQLDGAGKYFLVSVKMQAKEPWRLCLVDIFDNITPILEGDYAMPVPLLARKKPAVVPSRIDLTKKTGTAMITDIYVGPGLKGFPPGSIKQLRIGTYHYRYPGNGDTYATAHEGGWDIRRIMGTVPVEEDGSAWFEIPANLPIFVQPLDANGQALQVMRSWFTAMPGENLACIGCHESQNMAPPSAITIAARKAPTKIKPWNGPMRGYSFDREVQPVLDAKCAGCHDGSKTDKPDFRAKRLHKDFEGKYSPAYMALQKYVRRAGFENDYHTPSPGEYQADTSHVIQMLKKGHNNVRLTRDQWERIYTWIDFNIPYPSNWNESHRAPKAGQATQREKMFKLYAFIDDKIESTTLALPPIAKFQAPTKLKTVAGTVSVKGWPMEVAPLDPKAKPKVDMELDLGDDIKMPLVKIDAGQFIMGDENGFSDERPRTAKIAKPFYMGTMEVSFQQYRQFDPKHENKFVSTRRKDQSKRGAMCMDVPDLPVVRISQDQAAAFCKWLSKKTGKKVTLPSEEQWEWACRAGSDKRFSFGAKLLHGSINIADGNAASWNYGRAEPGYKDSDRYVAKVNSYKPNAWGLYNMHGNVAEWTTSDYAPLKDIGEVAGTAPVPYKVVRGGSWNDTARFATAAARWRYPHYQPVYNVGFRVIVQD